MSDVLDSPLWKLFSEDPQMQATSQCRAFPDLDNSKTGLNIALVGCTDGASPFGRTNYSFSPFAFACLNLPPWIRQAMASTHIAGIVPGRKLFAITFFHIYQPFVCRMQGLPVRRTSNPTWRSSLMSFCTCTGMGLNACSQKLLAVILSLSRPC